MAPHLPFLAPWPTAARAPCFLCASAQWSSWGLCKLNCFNASLLKPLFPPSHVRCTFFSFCLFSFAGANVGRWQHVELTYGPVMVKGASPAADMLMQASDNTTEGTRCVISFSFSIRDGEPNADSQQHMPPPLPQSQLTMETLVLTGSQPSHTRMSYTSMSDWGMEQQFFHGWASNHPSIGHVQNKPAL
jgi:hypothetical protein